VHTERKISHAEEMADIVKVRDNQALFGHDCHEMLALLAKTGKGVESQAFKH